MDSNILWIIVVGAIAVIAGYFFGMADSRVTNAYKENRAKEADAKDADAKEAAASRLDEHSVLRVSVDPALKWHLELDGEPIEPEGLTPEQRSRLVNVIVQIRPWIDGKLAAPPVPSSPPPATVSEPFALPSQLHPQTTPIPRPLQPAGPPRLDIGRGFRSLLESDIVKPDLTKGTSIVAMIDDVLQRKLENSLLADKRIRLEEGSVGEVVVFVGVQRYSGVDSVPDEDIKSIIKAAIAEWDKA